MRRTLRRFGAHSLLVVALAGTAASIAVSSSVAPAAAASGITGAGSTFAQIAIDEWRAATARKYGLQVNYNGNGSTAGRSQFMANQLDFASSDIAFEPEEPITRGFTYLPLVAGGTALLYNLRDKTGAQIRDLRLSGPTIAAIFMAGISTWDSPQIVADNPHLAGKLPSTSISRVTRSGGSGTTAVFTGYMSRQDPARWAAFAKEWGNDIRPGASFTSTFPDVPGFQRLSGSDGVANFVASTPAGLNSIGYAEAGYGLQRGLPMVSVKNAAGRYTQPTARNQAIALTQATRNPDGTQNLDKVYSYDHPETYPISSYNYMIAPTTGFDPGKGETLGTYIIYAITEGQAKAEPLGYSPLPPNLVQQGLDAVRSIPGAPEPPPLGNWGRFYEGLNVDEALANPAATSPTDPAATAATNAAAAGAGTAAGTAATGGTAATAGAAGGAGAATKATAGGPTAGSAATKAATSDKAATKRGAGATSGQAIVDPTTGEAVDATGLEGDLAAGNLLTERRQLSTKDVDVDPSGATPLFLAGLAIAVVVLAPPLLAAPAGARAKRRH